MSDAGETVPTTLTGGCHCGAVRFEVQADISRVVACNCTICSTKGLMLTMVPASAFTLESGNERLSEYRFNRHVIGHMFCTACGVEPFARGVGRDGVEMVALNVRCIDGVDAGALDVMPFDGRSL